jgi:hypothetical protein
MNRQGAKDAKKRKREKSEQIETERIVAAERLSPLSFSLLSWRPWRLGG